MGFLLEKGVVRVGKTYGRRFYVMLVTGFPTSRERGFIVMERPPSYSFSVKPAYKKLANHGIEGVTESFAHLWNLKVMSSTQLYLWRALSDRIATKLNLHKRGLTLRDTLYALCGREEESTSHILVSCKVSTTVWNLCNNWLGISLVNHNELINHFEQF